MTSILIEFVDFAIHGDYDPHPAEGIKTPLKNVIEDFRFYLIKKCGHSPWKEQYANNRFYKIIREEIDSSIAQQQLHDYASLRPNWLPLVADFV